MKRGKKILGKSVIIALILVILLSSVILVNASDDTEEEGFFDKFLSFFKSIFTGRSIEERPQKEGGKDIPQAEEESFEDTTQEETVSIEEKEPPREPIGSILSTTVSDCANLDTEHEVYVLLNNVSAEGNCFNISANNVTFNLNGSSIIGNGSGRGIIIDNQNATIKDGYVTNFTSGIYPTAYTIYTNVINNTFYENSIGINWYGGGCILEDNIVKFNSGGGIYLDTGYYNTFDNNYIIHNTNYGIGLGTDSETQIAATLLLNNIIYNNTGSNILDDTSDLTPNFIIYNDPNYGEINFTTQALRQDLTTKLNFTDNIIGVGDNVAYFRNENFSGYYNGSANIILLNLPTDFNNPTILRNGNPCGDPECVNYTDLNAGTVLFQVLHWSNYSIGEMPIITNVSFIKTANTTNASEIDKVRFTLNITNMGEVNISNITVLDWFNTTEWQWNGSQPDTTGYWIVDDISFNQWNLTLNLEPEKTYLLNLTLNVYAWAGDNITNSANITVRYANGIEDIEYSDAIVSIYGPPSTCYEDLGNGVCQVAANCSCLTEAFTDIACKEVRLNESITSYNGTCVIIEDDDKIFDCQNNYIEGDLTTLGKGILLSNVDNVTVQNCLVTIFDNDLFLGYSSNCTIKNNKLNWTSYEGPLSDYEMYVYESYENIFENNSLQAMFLDSSSNNILLNNRIESAIGGVLYSGFGSTSNYFIYNNSEGEIFWTNSSFLDNFDIDGNLTFPGTIYISNNYTYLDEWEFGGNIYSPANITFYNMQGGFENPGILKNGLKCTSCVNYTSLNAATVIFEAQGFSNYTIGEVLVPDTTEYNTSYGSTDFSQVPDITNVTNMTLANEYGGIQFPEDYGVDAEAEDYDSFVEIGEGFISVNTTELDETFNSSCNITLSNIDCAVSIYYGDGFYTNRLDILNEENICDDLSDPSCTEFFCDGENLTFTISHFTGFAYAGITNLTIWDETDAEGGSQVRHIGDRVKFFANYTNSTGFILENSDCYINFTDMNSFMFWNSTSNLYEFNRTFAAKGIYDWNVTCNISGYDTLMANDAVYISNSPGNVTSVVLTTTNPATNDTHQNLTGFVTANDIDGDNLTYWYSWYMMDSPGPTTLIPDGLVSYYPFNNDSYDYWGGNDGTVYGDAHLNETNGKILGSYDFDGDDDGITFAVNWSELFTENGTVSFWTNFDSIIIGDNMIFANTANNNDFISYNSNPGGDYIIVKIGGTAAIMSISQDFLVNEWHHITVIKNLTNVYLYVDGFYEASGDASINPSNSQLKVGGYYNDNYDFNGSLDEVMIFNRSLTEQEVMSLYYGGLFGGDTINEEMTLVGDTWKLGVRAGDYDNTFGEEVNSSEVTVSFIGQGTQADPYNISDCEELQSMNTDLTAYYQLVNDIDCSETSEDYWSDGGGFMPIGNITSAYRFSGNFDGRNHTISDLYINRPGYYYVGLFGFSSGSITSVGLENINMTGSGIGGLCAYISGSEISYSYTTGNIQGQDGPMGGLIGMSGGGGNIHDSYSTVNVIGTYSVGGLMDNGANGLQITNCYATGNVSSTSLVGSVGGLIARASSGTQYINDSFATGNVSGRSSSIGGLVGSGGTVTNCYYNNFSENIDVCMGSGSGDCTAIQDHIGYFFEHNNAPMGSWDFRGLGEGVWDQVEGNTPNYPRLTWEGVGTGMLGSGSLADPYNITTCSQLQDMNDSLEANYSLISNINCSYTVDWNDGAGFDPVGVYSSYPFKGSLDGRSYNITDLYINRTGETRIGLFEYLKGEVTNLGLIDVNITGSNTVGGLFGRSLDAGPIDNCFVTGHVEGIINGAGNVGGFGGYAYGGAAPLISNSYANVEINGPNTLGGIIGNMDGDGLESLRNVHSMGNVTSRLIGGTGSSIGGLVGFFENGEIYDSSSMMIVNSTDGDNIGGLVGYLLSYSKIENSSFEGGNVIGEYTVGGLAGYVDDNSNIFNSYFNGSSVTGTGSYIGGIVGEGYGDIENCSATGTIGETGNYVGGIAGYNHGNIKNSYFTGSLRGATYIGGLAGRNDGSGKIFNSYAEGDMQRGGNPPPLSVEYYGGLVGYNDGNVSRCYSGVDASSPETCSGGLVGNNPGIIEDSFAYGNFRDMGYSDIGGLVGCNSGSIARCYYNNHTSNQDYCIGTGSGDCTTIQNNANHFQGDVYPNYAPMSSWDFYDTWQERTYHPSLTWQGLGTLLHEPYVSSVIITTTDPDTNATDEDVIVSSIVASDEAGDNITYWYRWYKEGDFDVDPDDCDDIYGDPGVVFYYTFDDSSSFDEDDYNGYDAQYINDVTWSSQSQVGDGSVFFKWIHSGGGSGTMNLGDIRPLSTGTNYEATFMHWSKPYNNAPMRIWKGYPHQDKTGDIVCTLSNNSGSGDMSIQSHIYSLGWKPGFNWNTPLSSVDEGIFHHVACVYNGTHLGVYFDGSLVNVADVPDSITDSSNPNPIALGGQANSGQSDGWMDEAAVFDRALSSDEIQAVYEKGLEGRGLCNPGGNLVPTTLIEDGLVSYYPFNNDTYDYWGGNDGVAYNGAFLNYSGKVGGSYQFDGSDDYMNMSSNAELEITGTALTLSVWIYPTDDHPNQAIIYKSQPNEPNGYGLLYNWNWGSGDLFGFVGTGTAKQHEFNAVVTLNDWNHVAIVYNGTDLVSYFNGEFDDSTSASGSIQSSSSNPLLLGTRWENGPITNFSGKIDEVLIFNRSLSASEVQQLYYGGLNGGHTVDDSRTAAGENWTLGVRGGDYGNTFGNEQNSTPLEILNTVSNTSYMNVNTTNVILNNTYQDLTCYAVIEDIDGGMVYANYSWYNNSVYYSSGQSGPFANGTLNLVATLSFPNTTTHETWTCSVKAYDGEGYEEDWNNDTVTILNQIPNITSVTLFSTDSSLNNTYQDLIGNVSVNDTDGENITLLYNWYRNGVLNGTTLIEDGLVAYYPLNNDTYDYKGENDGVVVNEASLNYSGKVGGCYSFDGTTDWIRVEDSPDWDFGANNYTISAWINSSPIDESDNDDARAIIGAGYKSVYDTWRLEFGHHQDFGSGTRLGFETSPAGGTATWIVRHSDSLDYTPWTWAHVVMTKDENNFRFYFNGESAGTTSSVDATAGNYLSIGVEQHFEDEMMRYWNGSIDEVMIFNRSLSESEVQQLYYGSRYGGYKIEDEYTEAGETWKLGVKAADYIDGFTNQTNSSEVEIIGCPTGMNGSGNSTDPCEITNCTQLQKMNLKLDNNYSLVNDIDCSDTINWNEGKGFDPVGDNSNRFTGSLEGNDYVISNMFINRSSTNYAGLFGYTDGAIISNIGMINADILGNTYVGGLIGSSNYNLIENVYTTGYVEGGIWYVGGIIGYFENSEIYDSYSSATVNGSNNQAAGIAGRNKESNITNSYFNGNVYGTVAIGGITGYNTGIINNTYVTGNVYGTTGVGGIVGDNGGSGSLYNSYTTGDVYGVDKVGGLVGNNGGLSENVFATGIVNGTTNVGGLVGWNEGSVINGSYNNHTNNPGDCVGYIDAGSVDCTTIQDNEVYFFDIDNLPITNWDFNQTWDDICDDQGYPSLALENLTSYTECRGYVAPAGGDTGGGGGGGVETKVYEPGEGQLEGGYYKDLAEDDKILFDVKEETHELELVDLSSVRASYMIRSNPISLVLRVGEEKEVDVDKDGENDILVRVDRILSGRARTFVQYLAVEPPTGVISEEEREEKAEEEQPKIVFTPEVKEVVKKVSYTLIILIVIGIIIFGAISLASIKPIKRKARKEKLRKQLFGKK